MDQMRSERKAKKKKSKEKSQKIKLGQSSLFVSAQTRVIKGRGWWGGHTRFSGPFSKFQNRWLLWSTIFRRLVIRFCYSSKGHTENRLICYWETFIFCFFLFPGVLYFFPFFLNKFLCAP